MDHKGVESIDALRAAARRFGGGAAGAKSRLLATSATLPLDEPAGLLAYHDVLLFLAAYPESAALRAQALRELRRVAAAARAIAIGTGVRRKRALAGSGVAWAESSFAFSWRIARWLAQKYPLHAELDAEGIAAGGVQKLLQLALPRIEMERLDEEQPDLADFFAAMRTGAKDSNLGWLLRELDAIGAGESVREQLYDALELPIRFAPRGAALSHTFARGPRRPAFYHRAPLLRELDTLALIERPLPEPMPLDRAEQSRLLDSARGVLATLGRETDVISFAWPDGVRAFALERGVSVVLYSAVPEKRFPIDTHVGFMLFKNGFPAAYGGGWPFAGSCRIGVNVFPAFRGGESTHWFAEVMRVYRQRFAVERFVVEPYQFGAGNREGLLSGAFWFYYRYGFRPVEPRAARTAETEFARIERERGYRSPLPVMRALTRDNLELRLPWAANVDLPWPEPYSLSIAVSDRIARDFGGDRALAQATSRTAVDAALGTERARRAQSERDAYASLSLLIGGIPELTRWSSAERKACAALMYAKGAVDEAPYLRATQRHARLRRALAALIREAD